MMNKKTFQKITALLLAVLLVCTALPYAAAEDASLQETAFTVEYLPNLGTTPTANTTGVVIRGLADGVSVTDLVIPETIGGYPVTEIWGISGMASLETVHIPSGVSKIDTTRNFRGCPNLRAFTVAAGNATFRAADGVLFQGTSLHTYPAAKTDTTYTLPKDCSAILNGAFCQNPYLETLTAPADMPSLYWNMDAVDACPSLSEIILLTSNVIFEQEVVINCPQRIRLHLSQGCDIPFHKTTMFSGCGAVTICTSIEIDDYYRTFAPLYGYGYTVCGDTHEPLVIDPESPVTIGEADSLACSPIYETVDGERIVTGVTVYGWNNLSNIAYDLIVPETIDGYPVTEIDVQGDDRILSLTVPKTVTRLYAADCTLLHTIDVDEDNAAFCSVNGVVYSKDGKRLVVFPAAHADTAYHILDGTEQIASGALGSAHIQSLYLPASLTKMDTFLATGRVFAAFVADENNTAFSTQDGVLYNKDKTALLQYPCAKTGDAFTIPSSVQYVETGAFYHNYCLSRVAFADGIDSTPIWRMKSNQYAVGQQTGITRVHIPSSVQTIHLTHFDVWAAVCTDDLPSAAGNFAAENKLELYLCNADHTNETKIAGNDPRLHPSTEIGFSCESIYDDDNALIGLRVVDFTNTPEGLYTVEIPETIGGYPVLEIDLSSTAAYAFRNLQGLAIPSTVRYIDPSCFLYCFNLNSIVVDMENPYYRDIDGVLFTADQKELVTYPAARVAYTYSVPEGTERITSEYAFAYCQYVTTLRLPASLTTLPTNRDGTYNFMRVDSRIRRIEADSANPAFRSDSLGVLYTKDMRTMIRCPVRNAGLESYTVPASVTAIGNALATTYSLTVARQGWYTPSLTVLRVLVFEDGMTTVPSFTPPTNPGSTTRSVRTMHIPSSVTQIEEIHTYSGCLICSDSATCFAARFAEMYGLLFAVCQDGVHDRFALPLIDNVGTPYRQYIAARVGQPIGTLPTRSSSAFLGWYSGGDLVTEDTVVTGYGMTLTAEWDETGLQPGMQPANAEYRLDPPAKRTYREGESFDPTGMTLYRRVDGGEWEMIATDGFSWSPEVFLFAGVQTMSVTYQGVYVGQLEVTVTENQVEYLLEPPETLTYDVGDTFDTTGMKLYRRVNGGEWILLAASGFLCTPNEFSRGGTQSVSVTYGDFIGSVQVYVQDLDYEYKLEPPVRLTYPVGASFNPTGMRVLRRVYGGEWEVYEDSYFLFTPSVFTTTGSQYVKVNCGSFTGNVRVNVTAEGTEYMLMPPIKTTYVVGETFDPLGISLLYRENGGSWEIVAEEGFTCTPSVLNESGTCSVNIRYGEFMGTVKVNVEEKAYVYGFEMPTKTTYYVGESFDPAGIRLLRREEGGDWEVVADSGIAFTPTVFWVPGTTGVILTYGNVTGSIEVTVLPAAFEYKLTTPTKTAYRVGESFDPAGMQLLRRANGGEWAVYAASGFICTPSVLTEEGEQTVTVQYGSFTGTVDVTVQPAEYEYRLTYPTKTTYIVGDAFDPAGMQLLRRVNGGSWTVYAASGFTCTPSVFTEEGEQTVRVTCGSFSGTVSVTVTEGISYEYRLTSPAKTTYTVGETFDPAGMRLMRRAEGGVWTVYATEGFEFWPAVFTDAGTQTVYVFYGGFAGEVNVNVIAKDAPAAEAVFSLTGGKAAAGETVQVSVIVSNNPGIVAARLSLTYDKTVLTLESVQNGGIFGATAFTRGGNLSDVPYTVLWEDSLNPNHTADGTLVTYTFRVKDDAEEGTTAVTLSYDVNSTYNADLDNVTFLVQDGVVTVQNRLPGDANGDGSVDLKDAAVLRRYLAGGWNVTVTEKNADVNSDGEITLKDVAYITRYLAGGWNITLV